MKNKKNIYPVGICRLILVFIVVIFNVNVFVYAQDAQEKLSIDIPILLHPSPEAASLGKYGDIPINYFTGVPDISIPIFEITDGSFQFPIELSYHASGNQVNDIASWVGLGWTLKTTGVINRKVNHLPDEDREDTIPTVKSLNDNKNYDYMHTHAVKSLTYQRDIQPDEFSYSFLDYSGKFYWDENKKAYLNPHNDLKIDFLNFPNSKKGYFRIKIPDGYQFIFRDYEYGVFNSASSNHRPETEINYMATTSWFLSDIISPSLDTICQFKYTNPATPSHTLGVTDRIYCNILANQPGCERDYIICDKSWIELNNYIYQIFLQEIIFNNGKIIFESIGGRKDINKHGLILNNLKIYSNSKIKKWIQFNTDFLYSEGYKNTPEERRYRLVLNSMIEKDANGNNIKEYRFDYNSIQLPPYYSLGIDLWGYFNGESNSTLIYWEDSYYKLDGRNFPFSIANRNTNEKFVQAGVLKRIYYPTKGFTDFEYESHKHDDYINSSNLVGGLRIKTIKNYDADGTLKTSKLYKYGDKENGFGKLICPNSYFDYHLFEANHRTDLSPYCVNFRPTYKKVELYSNPLDIPSYNSNELIYYPYVTEYTMDNSFSIIGKKVYEFDFCFDDFISQDYQKIITNYRWTNNSWRRGNLLKEEFYKGTTIDDLKLVHKKEYKYKEFFVGSVYGLSISPKWTSPTEAETNSWNFYSVYNKFENSGVKKVIQETENYYYQNGTVTKIKKYKYGKMDEKFHFTEPTEIVELLSSSDSIKTILKYPHDFFNIVYIGMVNRNIVPVVEKLVYKNNTFLSGIKTNYKKWYGSYLPTTVETIQGTNSPEVRLKYVKYNEGGKPMYIVKDDSTKIVYLWGHRNQYPIAVIKNATYDEVTKIISPDKIEYLANSEYSENQAGYYLNLLYNGLPNAQISLYKFNPLVGIKEIVDPRKISTYFDYDDFGRLQKSYMKKNSVNEILKSYEYHYKP